MSKETIIERINSFGELKPGWDCYEHSLAINTDIKKEILKFINSTDESYLTNWTVFPCVGGTILFDCLGKTIDACIDFAMDNKASAFIRINQILIWSIDNAPYSEAYKVFKIVYEHINNME